MEVSKSKALSLTLFLLSTIVFAVVQSQINAPDVHAILTQNGLPAGLLPSEAGSYAFINGYMKVVVPTSLCIVNHPSSTLRYDMRVGGMLSYAKLEDVQGIQLLLPSGFAQVTRIETIHDKVRFELRQAKQVSVVLPAVEFKDIPSCIWSKDGASAKDNPSCVLPKDGASAAS